MEQESTTQTDFRTQMLLDFIAVNRPDCPGCGHQLSSETRCPECGITPHLSLKPHSRFSLPWLFIFIPWLSLVGSGLLNLLLLLALLVQGGMDNFANSFQMIPSTQLPFVISLELILIGSPFIVAVLWRKRHQIRHWQNSTIFLLGIIPLLGWCYNLITASQVLNG